MGDSCLFVVAKLDELSHTPTVLVLTLSEREKVLNEVSRYRDLDTTQKWRSIKSACQAAAKMLASRPDAQRVLAFVDPLPERSKQILARLRSSSNA